MTYLARSAKQIGNTIQRVRKKQGLAQAELGQKAGLSQVTISHVEGGRIDAKFETLLRLLTALDLEFQIVPRSQSWDKDMEDLL